jgi:hypothetical protein
MRYAVYLRHPLQAPCGAGSSNWVLLLQTVLKYRSRRRGGGNVVIPKGFPKSVGRVGSRLHGFPCFPHSVISMACFSRGKCRINRYAADQCSVRHSPRAVHRYSSFVDECIGDLSSAKKNQPTSTPQKKSSTESLADSPRAEKSLRAILGYVGPNPRKVQYLCRTFASADLHSTASLPSLS